MRKFTNKYLIVCDECNTVCGTYDKNTDELKTKSRCDCGSDELNYVCPSEYDEMITGGLDSDV